jgi:hypothetical protein
MAIFTLSILNPLDFTVEPMVDIPAPLGNGDVFQVVDLAASFLLVGEDGFVSNPEECGNVLHLRRNAPGRTGFEWNIGGAWRRFAA